MPPVTVKNQYKPPTPSLIQRAKAKGVSALKAIDDALVPGKGKASNIGRDAKKIVDLARGKKGK